MTFWLKRKLSEVRLELEGPPEAIAQCKPGLYVDGEHGGTYLISKVNPEANTIEVTLTVSERFSLPGKR